MQYKTVFQIIHETRLEQPLAQFTDQQLADWLSEAENDIQVNVLLMTHEDVKPIVYAEKWLFMAGVAGLPAGEYQFGKPGIDPDTGAEVTETRGFTTEEALQNGDTLMWDGYRLRQTRDGVVSEIELNAEPSGIELRFYDNSRLLLTPVGWAGLYVDWLLYKMYKAAREYRDARNHEAQWQQKRDDFCGYVGDRWAPARFRG